jgi:hypothetical protein
VLLPAAVEICLATGRIAEAKDVITESETTPQTYPTTAMRAILDAAREAVALSEDRPADALARLREASIGGGSSTPPTKPPRSAYGSGRGAGHSGTRKAR